MRSSVHEPARKVPTMWPDGRWYTAVLAIALCVMAPERSEAQQSGTLTAAVELRLDAVDGDPFGRVSGLALDPSSSDVFLVEEFSAGVHRFNPDGGLVYSFGGIGDGPGEFRAPCCPAFGPDGLLWVQSGRNSLEGFRVEDDRAIYERPLRFIQRSRDVARRIAPAFLADSAVVVLMTRRERDGVRSYYRLVKAAFEPPASQSEVLFEVPGDSVDYLVMEAAGGLQIPVGVPNARAYATALGRDGRFAWADNSRYEVSVLAADGARLLLIRQPFERRPLTRAQRDSVSQFLSTHRARMGSNVTVLRVPDPQFAPVLTGLWFDAEGRLWVGLGSPPDSRIQTADVYDPTGQLLFRARWPRNVDLTFGAARGLTAWGVEFGPFDEPSLVRIRFR